MPIRRGEQFLESLRDGRRVWLQGESVEDVTAHPRLRGCARSVAAVYDLQHVPAYHDLLTMPSPVTGQRVSLAYLMPRSVEDLTRQRKMYELLVRRSGGVAARLPQHLATVILGLHDVRDILGKENPAFAENVTRYFEYCRENDLAIATIFNDPFHHRSHPESQQEYLRVVERRPDGIVVSGAKGVGTQAPYANDILCLTQPRPNLQPEEVLYFAAPVNSRGLQLICREPMASANPEDHPLSPHWDEMDAMVLFDDVFIPWDRVFYLRRSEPEDPSLYARLFQGAMGIGPWYVLVRMAVKAEVLLGVCAAMAEYLGTSKQPHVQMALADAIIYLETMRAFIHTAETNPVRSQSGLTLPNWTPAQAARIFSIERYPQMLQMMRELCGSGILMSPSQSDMDNPEVGQQIQRYFVGDDERTQERFRMLKLAWEYACDSFGSRQLLFEMFNVASLATNKQRLVNSYDLSPYVRLAKELAGIRE
jgi:4-hydroxyphenylacetate 3-monooxygenase